MQEDAPSWLRAIKSELSSLLATNTYTIIQGNPSERGRKLITSKWVLRNIFDADGNISRYKAHLVVRGFEQTYRVDYFKIFASII